MCVCVSCCHDHSLLFGCDSLKQVELGFSPQAVCSGLSRAALLRDSLTLKGVLLFCFFLKFFSPSCLFMERETTQVLEDVTATVSRLHADERSADSSLRYTPQKL